MSRWIEVFAALLSFAGSLASILLAWSASRDARRTREDLDRRLSAYADGQLVEETATPPGRGDEDVGREGGER